MSVGDPAAAVRLLREIESEPATRQDANYAAYLPAMVRTALAAGEPDLANRLVSGFEARHPYGAHALVAADAALAEDRGDLADAAATYADAADRWERFGVIPEQAFALLGQGRCLVGLRRPAEALTVLREARDLFERLGAAPALAEIDALLIDVPTDGCATGRDAGNLWPRRAAYTAAHGAHSARRVRASSCAGEPWGPGCARPRPGYRAAVRDADPAHVRLRVPGRRPGALPRGDRAVRAARSACCWPSRSSATPAISLWLTTHADRIGRRRVLLVGRGPDARRRVRVRRHARASWCSWSRRPSASSARAATRSARSWPSSRRPCAAGARRGGGPGSSRWYQLAGSFATAAGTLVAGGVVVAGRDRRRREPGRRLPARHPRLRGRRWSCWPCCSRACRPRVEVPPADVTDADHPGRASASTARAASCLRLSALFALDAFAGGFVIRASSPSGSSAITACDPGAAGADPVRRRTCWPASRPSPPGALAARFGLVRTMVFTHLPSNVLLMLVPVDAHPAARRWRCCWRGSHQPDGRPDAPVLHDGDRRARRAIRRGRGHGHRAQPRASLRRPLIAGAAVCERRVWPACRSSSSGGLKIVYDLLLYRSFKRVRPPEEAQA